jgi:hypothetical protein
MSHHASGPNFGFPRGDARLDMTDLYAFTKPGDPAKSIIVLNVHPSFALNSPEPTTTEPFAPGALYEVKVDTDGNAVADLAYSVQFASSGDGKQTATVRRLQGVRAAGVGEEGEVIVQQAPVSVGREALVTKAGDYRFFFGWRSDPFFFDVNGNFNHMQFTGDDFFADKNVCSIVIELLPCVFAVRAICYGIVVKLSQNHNVGHRCKNTGSRKRARRGWTQWRSCSARTGKDR